MGIIPRGFPSPHSPDAALRGRSRRGRCKGCFLHPGAGINTDQETPLPMSAAILPSLPPPLMMLLLSDSILYVYTDFTLDRWNISHSDEFGKLLGIMEYSYAKQILTFCTHNLFICLYSNRPTRNGLLTWIKVTRFINNNYVKHFNWQIYKY